VIAALPAAGLAACVVVGAVGWRMMRDPGPIDRFARADGDEQRRRRSIVTVVFDLVGDRLAPRLMRRLGPARLATIRRRIDSAGRPGGMTIESYAGRKAAFTVLVGGAGFFLFLQGSPLLGVCLAVLGWLWLDIWLGIQARRRQAAIDRDLPDFLDILAVTVGAGVGFRSALARVVDAVGGPLGEEIGTALRAMDLGSPRRRAFEDLRARNESDTLSQFVTALLQAEELGAPLADTLNVLADEMRRSAHQDARRRAARAAPRISLVVTIVIAPAAVMLIVAGLFISSDFDLGGILG
jgi:tight adherence protein C